MILDRPLRQLKWINYIIKSIEDKAEKIEIKNTCRNYETILFYKFWQLKYFVLHGWSGAQFT